MRMQESGDRSPIAANDSSFSANMRAPALHRPETMQDHTNPRLNDRRKAKAVF